MELLAKKEILLRLKKQGAFAYFKLRTDYREKRFKKQKKISQLQIAMLSGSIRRIK
jgi:hypothetical protein